MSNGIRTEANVTSTFSYAMQQNCIPLIREIRIVNESGEDAENITVKAEFDPPFAKPFEQTVPTVAAGRTAGISPVKISVSTDHL